MLDDFNKLSRYKIKFIVLILAFHADYMLHVKHNLTKATPCTQKIIMKNT